MLSRNSFVFQCVVLLVHQLSSSTSFGHESRHKLLPNDLKLNLEKYKFLDLENLDAVNKIQQNKVRRDVSLNSLKKFRDDSGDEMDFSDYFLEDDYEMPPEYNEHSNAIVVEKQQTGSNGGQHQHQVSTKGVLQKTSTIDKRMNKNKNVHHLNSINGDLKSHQSSATNSLQQELEKGPKLLGKRGENIHTNVKYSNVKNGTQDKNVTSSVGHAMVHFKRSRPKIRESTMRLVSSDGEVPDEMRNNRYSTGEQKDPGLEEPTEQVLNKDSLAENGEMKSWKNSAFESTIYRQSDSGATNLKEIKKQNSAVSAESNSSQQNGKDNENTIIESKLTESRGISKNQENAIESSEIKTMNASGIKTMIDDILKGNISADNVKHQIGDADVQVVIVKVINDPSKNATAMSKRASTVTSGKANEVSNSESKAVERKTKAVEHKTFKLGKKETKTFNRFKELLPLLLKMRKKANFSNMKGCDADCQKLLSITSKAVQSFVREDASNDTLKSIVNSGDAKAMSKIFYSSKAMNNNNLLFKAKDLNINDKSRSSEIENRSVMGSSFETRQIVDNETNHIDNSIDMLKMKKASVAKAKTTQAVTGVEESDNESKFNSKANSFSDEIDRFLAKTENNSTNKQHEILNTIDNSISASSDTKYDEKQMSSSKVFEQLMLNDSKSNSKSSPLKGITNIHSDALLKKNESIIQPDILFQTNNSNVQPNVMLQSDGSNIQFDKLLTSQETFIRDGNTIVSEKMNELNTTKVKVKQSGIVDNEDKHKFDYKVKSEDAKSDNKGTKNLAKVDGETNVVFNEKFGKSKSSSSKSTEDNKFESSAQENTNKRYQNEKYENSTETFKNKEKMVVRDSSSGAFTLTNQTEVNNMNYKAKSTSDVSESKEVSQVLNSDTPSFVFKGNETLNKMDKGIERAFPDDSVIKQTLKLNNSNKTNKEMNEGINEKNSRSVKIYNSKRLTNEVLNRAPDTADAVEDNVNVKIDNYVTKHNISDLNFGENIDYSVLKSITNKISSKTNEPEAFDYWQLLERSLENELSKDRQSFSDNSKVYGTVSNNKEKDNHVELKGKNKNLEFYQIDDKIKDLEGLDEAAKEIISQIEAKKKRRVNLKNLRTQNELKKLSKADGSVITKNMPKNIKKKEDSNIEDNLKNKDIKLSEKKQNNSQIKTLQTPNIVSKKDNTYRNSKDYKDYKSFQKALENAPKFSDIEELEHRSLTMLKLATKIDEAKKLLKTLPKRGIAELRNNSYKKSKEHGKKMKSRGHSKSSQHAKRELNKFLKTYASNSEILDELREQVMNYKSSKEHKKEIDVLKGRTSDEIKDSLSDITGDKGKKTKKGRKISGQKSTKNQLSDKDLNKKKLWNGKIEMKLNENINDNLSFRRRNEKNTRDSDKIFQYGGYSNSKKQSYKDSLKNFFDIIRADAKTNFQKYEETNSPNPFKNKSGRSKSSLSRKIETDHVEASKIKSSKLTPNHKISKKHSIQQKYSHPKEDQLKPNNTSTAKNLFNVSDMQYQSYYRKSDDEKENLNSTILHPIEIKIEGYVRLEITNSEMDLSFDDGKDVNSHELPHESNLIFSIMNSGEQLVKKAWKPDKNGNEATGCDSNTKTSTESKKGSGSTKTSRKNNRINKSLDSAKGQTYNISGGKVDKDIIERLGGKIGDNSNNIADAKGTDLLSYDRGKLHVIDSFPEDVE